MKKNVSKRFKNFFKTKYRLYCGNFSPRKKFSCVFCIQKTNFSSRILFSRSNKKSTILFAVFSLAGVTETTLFSLCYWILCASERDGNSQCLEIFFLLIWWNFFIIFPKIFEIFPVIFMFFCFRKFFFRKVYRVVRVARVWFLALRENHNVCGEDELMSSQIQFRGTAAVESMVFMNSTRSSGGRRIFLEENEKSLQSVLFSFSFLWNSNEWMVAKRKESRSCRSIKNVWKTTIKSSDSKQFWKTSVSVCCGEKSVDYNGTGDIWFWRSCSAPGFLWKITLKSLNIFLKSLQEL